MLQHTGSTAGLVPDATTGRTARGRRSGDRFRSVSMDIASFPPRTEPFRAPSVRLALRAVGLLSRPVGVDGAWWPRTRELTRELAELADVLDPLWGRITHVAVNPRHWPAVRRGTLVVNEHEVTVDWFASHLNPHRILLRSYTAGHWDLLVVPPQTPAAAAARLMAAASATSGDDAPGATELADGTRGWLSNRSAHPAVASAPRLRDPPRGRSPQPVVRRTKVSR